MVGKLLNDSWPVPTPCWYEPEVLEKVETEAASIVPRYLNEIELSSSSSSSSDSDSDSESDSESDCD
jgi:hypothetical protein